MSSLARGQKIKLADLTSALQLRAGLAAQAPGVAFDFSCFGVDAGDKLVDDRYFVFFNQKSSPEGALKQSGAQNGENETFEIDLSRLPSTIRNNYGILQDLDTMRGRVVDNANFFHVDDLKRIDDETLYNRLLGEFPAWLREARAKTNLR